MLTSEAGRERRILLERELAAMGLPVPSFDTLEDILEYPCLGGVSGDAAARLVEGFLQGGFPTLDWTVKVLAPFIRQQMLCEFGCWIEDERNCLSFLAGSEDYPNVHSVIKAISKDRDIRQRRLDAELQEQGVSLTNLLPHFDYSALAQSPQHAFVDSPQHAFVNSYRKPAWAFVERREGNAVAEATQAFIERGEGNARVIAYAAAVDARRKELASAFRAQKVRPSSSIEESGFFSIATIDSIQEYKNRNMVSDKIVRAFIFGENIQCQAHDVVAKVQAGRKPRQEIVDGLVSQYGLDMDPLRQSRQYYSELSRLDRFVEGGEGDARFALATIAFEESLKSCCLPGSEQLFRKTPELKERFEAAYVEGSSPVLGLVEELAEAKTLRFQEAANTYLRVQQPDWRRGETALDETERNHLKSSSFVCFGFGSAQATAQSCEEMKRRNGLQEAMSKVVPEVPLSMLYENQLLEDFVKGTSAFVNEQEVLEALHRQKAERIAEIEKLLDEQMATPATIYELRKQRPFRRYVSGGSGSPYELVHGFAQSKRREKLRSLLESPPDVLPSSYAMSIAMSMPQCKDFVAGKSSISCNELVSFLKQSFQKRKDVLQKVFGACKTSQQALCSGGEHALDLALDKYVFAGSGDVSMLEQAVKFYAELGATREAFDSLEGILPHAGFDRGLAWKGKLDGIMSACCVNIVEHALSRYTGSSLHNSKHADEGGDDKPRIVGPEDLSQCIAIKILSFCEADYTEAIRFGLSAPSLGHDPRLLLLVTCPEECPWNSAVQAVAEIRRERSIRDARFGAVFSPERYATLRSNGVIPYGLGGLRHHLRPQLQTPRDQLDEDRLLRENGPRADYVNGKISLEKAVSVANRQERESLLKAALVAASLSKELMTLHEDCVRFLESETRDGHDLAVANLVSQSQSEKVERGGRLLLRLSKVVPGLSMSSYVDAGILCLEDPRVNWCDEDKPLEAFPERSNVSCRTFRYVELGQGVPEDVVRSFVMLQRKEKLEQAVRNEREVKFDWCVQKSKKCKAFVSDTDAGVPSDEDIESFIIFLKNKLKLKGKYIESGDRSVDLDEMDGSDDDRSSYNVSDGDYYDWDGPPETDWGGIDFESSENSDSEFSAWHTGWDA